MFSYPEDLMAVREALENGGFKIESAQVHQVPKNTVKTEGKAAEKVLKLVSALEDHEDTSSVAANFDIDAELIERIEL